MTVQDYLILRFCCTEITNQQDSPVCVFDLFKAWEKAQEWAARSPFPSQEQIQELGWLCKPMLNMPGRWRRVDIMVGDNPMFPRADQVPRLMDLWHQSLSEGVFTPEEAYKSFEEIHPFRDGNGRTGKIIYNWLNGTLDAPRMPPNFWGTIP